MSNSPSRDFLEFFNWLIVDVSLAERGQPKSPVEDFLSFLQRRSFFSRKKPLLQTTKCDLTNRLLKSSPYVSPTHCDLRRNITSYFVLRNPWMP